MPGSSTSRLAVLALLLATTAAGFLWRAGRSGSPRAPLPAVPPAPRESSTLGAPEAKLAPVVIEALPTDPIEEPTVRKQATPTDIEAPVTRLVGSLVKPDGTPWSGARIHALVQPQRKTQRFPISEHETHTETDGAFELAVRDAPFPGKVELTFAPEHGVRSQAQKSLPRRGRKLNVGRVYLCEGATLAGRVVRPSDRPVGDGWAVRVETFPREEVRGAGDATRDHWPVDPIEGTFHVTGLPPGSCRVRLVRPGRTLASTVVAVHRGGEHEVELLCHGLELDRRIAIQVLDQGYGDAGLPEVESMVLVGDGRELRPVPIGKGSFLFDDLEPESGPYTFQVVDPRFLPLAHGNLRPGDPPLEIQLEGSSSLQLVLRKPAAREITNLRVRMTIREPRHRKGTPRDRTVYLVEHDRPLPPDGRIQGLVAHPSARVLVEAMQLHARKRPLRLEPGQQTLLEVNLAPVRRKPR